MNRDQFIDNIRKIKQRVDASGKAVSHIGVSPMVLLKLACTHVHGLELVKCPQLENDEFWLFARNEEGKLKKVSL